jgi:hypothetical protein
MNVYDNATANNCMNALMTNLLTGEAAITYDGLFLRENSPFTISNGADLDPSDYIRHDPQEN